MPQETDRLKLPLPLGNETVNRESINRIFEKIDAGVATQADLDALREAVSKMDIPDASLTQKGKVQLSSKTDGTSETMAATEKAVNDVLATANAASLPRTGGALTGPLRISSWGDISASSGGYVLYGHNCYLDGAGVVYRYRNTHATMGARGVVFRLGAGLQGAWMFDMGAIATTAGASFSPTLKRILNTDDYTAVLEAAKAYVDESFRKPSELINANLVKNSSGMMGFDYWQDKGVIPWSVHVNQTVGSFFNVNQAVPSQQYAVLDSEAIGVVPTGKYLLQAVFHTSDTTSTTLIEVKDKNTDVTIDSLVANPLSWWHRKTKVITIPAGVTSISLRLVVTNAGVGTKGFARIKFNEIYGEDSRDYPYTDESSTRALYEQNQVVKQSGVDAKNGIVGAINAKGGSASTNDSWGQLSAKVQTIQTGLSLMTGKVSAAGGRIDIPGYRPQAFILHSIESRNSQLWYDSFQNRTTAWIYSFGPLVAFRYPETNNTKLLGGRGNVTFSNYNMFTGAGFKTLAFGDGYVEFATTSSGDGYMSQEQTEYTILAIPV